MISALFSYLDDEHERRAAFETDVIARLGRLEPFAAIPITEARQSVDPGFGVPVGVYAGDGHPDARKAE